MTTSATEKQSLAIKHRMAEIRTELPYDVDEARQRVRQLTDWKYHLSRHPLPLLGAAAVVGFFLVPSKQSQARVIIHRDVSRTDPEPATRGMMGGIAAAVVTMAVRHATTMAANRISSLIAKRGSL